MASGGRLHDFYSGYTWSIPWLVVTPSGGTAGQRPTAPPGGRFQRDARGRSPPGSVARLGRVQSCLEHLVDLHLQRRDQPIGLHRHADDGGQFSVLCVAHAFGLGGGGVGVHAVGTAVGG